MELDWKNWVDNEVVGNYWRNWAKDNLWCFGPIRYLGDFSNRDFTSVNMDCWWALGMLHSYIWATFDEP